MMHGPCGQRNLNCPSMVDGKCKNHYPKDFCDVTVDDEDGYPRYRRRDNGRTVVKFVHGEAHELDNRSLVPYNRALCIKYDCHMLNTEC